MAGKYFWIKERENPQIKTYFVAMGRISIKTATAYETKNLYGFNIMHKFTTKEAYEKKLAELKARGERVEFGGTQRYPGITGGGMRCQTGNTNSG